MKEAEKIKAIYRVEVADQYMETDNSHDLGSLLNQLVGGYGDNGRHFEKPIKPDDIRITVRSAPADPPPTKWKPIT